MRLGVPFIAPRQLGAVENKSGRPSLPFVVGRTGQSGAHRTLSGARFPSLTAQSTVADAGAVGAPDMSGAHRTVRCPLPTVGSATCPAQIERPTVGSPDSPVNFSRTPSANSRERPLRAESAWRTGHCPVCQTELSLGCTQPSLFQLFSFLLLSVSNT